MQPVTTSQFTEFEPRLIEEIEKSGILKKMGAGEELMRPGMYVRSIPIILSGSLKIMRQDDGGNETFLYFLTKGDTCAMSLTCCSANRPSTVRAVAEEPTELIMVPVEKLDQWMTMYPSWKIFVFQAYQRRFDDMLEAVDSLAFRRMDERIWRLLKKKAALQEKRFVYSTHQELADELSTSREVVTRLLKKLEGMGKIKTHRNRIEIIEVRGETVRK
ncbi:MAG: Crp/Fnr family transcriptional regulator [Bacteroidetes bacterium]|nr:Crp/Fnr family transcriptional regulator [Bacteroidota bacterium]